MKWLLSKLRDIRNIKRETVIKNSFLLPILSVVIISISHVISWYDLGNPIAWAIYLSVAVEIFALASVSAASIKIKKGSIWFLFGLVTMIQIVGNVFFTYKDIDVTGEGFVAWVELIGFWFEDWNVLDHKRFLAYIQGGTLPLMSLIALHFYIKFNENLQIKNDDDPNPDDYYDARNRRMEEMVQAREAEEEAKARRADNKMAFDTSIDADDAMLWESPITEEIKKAEEKSEESKAKRVKAPTPTSADTEEKLIPDSEVKEALKEEQKKKEEIDSKIVQKVTPKPNTGSGQFMGHKKPKNPGKNPQILPGTN